MKHNNINYLILIVIIIFVFTEHALAMDTGKSLSMGGAIVAIADDLSAPFYNPAGLAQVEGHQVGFSEKNTSRDTVTNNFSGSILSKEKGNFSWFSPDIGVLIIPLGKGNLSMGVGVLQDYLIDISTSFEGTAINSKIDSINYLSGISYGMELYNGVLVGISAGPAQKQYKSKSEYVGMSPSSSEILINSSGLGVIVGALLKMTPDFSIGTSLDYAVDVEVAQDIRQTIGSTPISLGLKYREQTPLTYKVGIAYRLRKRMLISLQADFIFGLDYDTQLTIEQSSTREVYNTPIKTDSYIVLRAGFEYLIPFRSLLLPLRIGYFYKPRSKIFSDVISSYSGYQIEDESYAYSLGTGFKRGNLNFDFAIQMLERKLLVDRFTNNFSETVSKDMKILGSVIYEW